MSLPSYDWFAGAPSETRELVAKERAGVTGSASGGAGVVVALIAIAVALALIYLL